MTSPAETNVAPALPPFAEVQDMIAGLHDEHAVTVTHRLKADKDIPITVPAELPDLISAEDSPYGASIKLTIDNSYGQTHEAFHLLDIRDKPSQFAQGKFGRLVGGVMIDNPSATHLLVNRHFGSPDSTVPGYKALTPEWGFSISRDSADKDTARMMKELFGISGETMHSRISRKGQTFVSVHKNGSVELRDLGSTHGTWVTTAKIPDSSPTAPQAVIGQVALK